jgi:hypothetical protein
MCRIAAATRSMLVSSNPVRVSCRLTGVPPLMLAARRSMRTSLLQRRWPRSPTAMAFAQSISASQQLSVMLVVCWMKLLVKSLRCGQLPWLMIRQSHEPSTLTVSLDSRVRQSS